MAIRPIEPNLSASTHRCFGAEHPVMSYNELGTRLIQEDGRVFIGDHLSGLFVDHVVHAVATGTSCHSRTSSASHCRPRFLLEVSRVRRISYGTLREPVPLAAVECFGWVGCPSGWSVTAVSAHYCCAQHVILSQSQLAISLAVYWHAVHAEMADAHTDGIPIPKGSQPQPKHSTCSQGTVRVKSHEEILRTLDTSSRTAAAVGRELVPYCGKTYRVADRVYTWIRRKEPERWCA